MNMSAEQARVIDPILTNHARGYANAEHVGSVLFPPVPMPVRGMRRIEFGKEAFRLYSTRRAPGATRKAVQFGHQGYPVALDQHSLAGKVPIEIMQEAKKVPNIDMGRNAVNSVLSVISLNREVSQGTLARNAALYDANHKLALSGADKWSDHSGTSNPAQDVLAAKEAVRSTIGRYPNTMVIGPAVFAGLQEHPVLRERFKYTSSDSLTTEMLARYFNVETVKVGGAVFLPEDAADDDPFTDVWGADAVLAYVPTAGERQMAVPSYGYTYHLENHPYVLQAWFSRDNDSWMYPVNDELSVEMVGPAAGFLIQGAA